MADHSIKPYLHRIPKRERPSHIAIPLVPAVQPWHQIPQPLKEVARQGWTVSSIPPRPPVLPRGHTLAEICRYADEQCAYIEWMTRELEAEEANRRHSTPTTPAGAITNPFSGPADMWWRPTSANEMYGKSALRRQQEEEETLTQHPYLAANGLPELLGMSHPHVNDSDDNTDDGFEEVERRTSLYSSNSPAPADIAGHAVESERFFQPLDDKILGDPDTASEYENLPARPRGLATEQSPQGRHEFDLPCLEQDTVILIIPRALLCFLLLPLMFAIGWCSIGFDEDGQEGDAEEEQEDQECRGRTSVVRKLI